MDHCFGVQSQQGLDQYLLYINLTYVISCQQNIPDNVAPTNLEFVHVELILNDVDWSMIWCHAISDNNYSLPVGWLYFWNDFIFAMSCSSKYDDQVIVYSKYPL